MKHGEHYGLTFNWDKLAMICINCDPVIAKPNGCNVSCSQSMVYLGGVTAADGHNTSEINRRIGLANREFASLQSLVSRESFCSKEN